MTVVAGRQVGQPRDSDSKGFIYSEPVRNLFPGRIEERWRTNPPKFKLVWVQCAALLPGREKWS